MKKTYDESTMARLQKKAAEQAEATATSIEMLGKQLQALNTGLTVTLNADGSRTLKSAKSALTIGADLKTMQKGTIFAQPGHAVMHAAESKKTVEAQAARIILNHLPDGMKDKNIAAVFVRQLTAGMWLTGTDEALLTGAAARRTAPSIRPEISKAVALAQKLHGEEGAKRVRQALNIMPGLAGVLTASNIVTLAVDGASIDDMAGEVHGTDVLRHLSPSAVTLLTQANAARISMVLADVVQGGKAIPTGRKQRTWLEAILPVIGLREPVTGFHAWLARQSSDPAVLGFLSAADLNLLSLWASAKSGARDGWKASLGLSTAMLRADAWRDGQSRQKLKEADDGQPLIETVKPATHGSIHLKQLLTVAEIREAGEELSNCLASIPTAFHSRCKAGEAVILALYQVNTSTKGDSVEVKIGKIVAAAELTLPGLDVLQFRSKFNSSPTHQQKDALAQHIAAHKAAI